VGEAVVELLFPAGQTGRIPLVAVTGVNGKTTTTRLTAHLLRQAGWCVGMTCTDGTYVDGRRTEARDCSGPQSARAVLSNPAVEAAVLETARGGILREGLGFDRCDVAVVTNIGQGDHFGLRGIETLEDLARVKRTVVEAVAPTGAAVLNAHDPLVAAMAGHSPGAVIYFAREAGLPVVAAHRQAGGRAVLARRGQLVLADGPREEALAPLAEVPLTHGGGVAFQVENALAAAAAAWALGLPGETLRAGLGTFTGNDGQAPGRFNVLRAGGETVVVDYAHNPSALSALIEALACFPSGRRTAVYTGCNRRDAEVVAMGEMLGHGFDAVILYPDRGHSGRADGTLNALLRQGLSAGRRVRQVVEAEGELAAVRQALESRRPGDLIVLGIESIEEVLALLRPYCGDPGGEARGPLEKFEESSSGR
jgi:cyanophycin synthetase